MKTIGYVLPSFPTLSETFIGTEMRAMERRGHRIVPLAFSRRGGPIQPIDAEYAERTIYLDETSPWQALNIARCISSRAPSAVDFSFRQRALPPRSLLWHGLRIATLAFERGCEHLHAHYALSTAATAIVAARFTGMSVSFVGHGFDIYSTQRDLDLKLKNVDFSVAVCEDMAKLFADLAPRGDVKLVPCGIDTARFQHAPAHGSTQPALLFVGRLVEKKGADILLRALALVDKHERPRLDIVGDGPLRAELEHMAQQLGLAGHVRFLGSLPSEWIIEHGSAYAALVAPFRPARNGDRDTGPVVAKEAMALGLPVIATRFMGLREIVEDGATGVLVPIDDSSALATAIRRVTHMPTAARESMAARAKRRVRELFDADAMAARLSHCVEAV